MALKGISPGLASGAAYRHDFNQDMDRLFRNEQLRTQQQQIKEQKAKFYGKMLQEPHVRGEGPSKRLEEYINKLNSEVADFVTKNPDFETDAGKFAEFRRIADRYLNNPIVAQDEQVRKNFELFQQDAASGELTQDEIVNYGDQYQEYLETGEKPFTYVRPMKISFGNIVTNAAESVGLATEDVIQPNGEIIEQTVPTDEGIEQAVDNTLLDKEYLSRVEKAYREAGGERIGSMRKWLSEKIRAQIDTQELNRGLTDYAKMKQKMAMEGNNLPPSRFKRDVADKLISAINSGENTYIPGGSENLVFTGLEEGQNIMMLAQDEFYFTPEEETGQIQQYYPGTFENKDGNIMNGTPAKVLGGRGITVIDGIPYIETEVDIALDKDSEKIDELKSRGFKETSSYGEDYMQAGFGSGKDIIKLRGRMFKRANINRGSVIEYENHYSGGADMKMARRGYGEFGQAFEQADWINNMGSVQPYLRPESTRKSAMKQAKESFNFEDPRWVSEGNGLMIVDKSGKRGLKISPNGEMFEVERVE